MKKKMVKTLLLCGLVGAVGVGGTYAYFTGNDSAVNSVTVGNLTTSINEDYPSGQKITADSNAVPSIKKVVAVSNDGEESVDCYVRVELSYSNSDISKGLTLQGLNTTDWVKSGNWYYYKKVLKSGQKTSNLMTGYSINVNKIDTTYKDYIDTFSVNVYEESVPVSITETITPGHGNVKAVTQVKNFSTPQEAFTYFETARK